MKKNVDLLTLQLGLHAMFTVHLGLLKCVEGIFAPSRGQDADRRVPESVIVVGSLISAPTACKHRSSILLKVIHTALV